MTLTVNPTGATTAAGTAVVEFATLTRAELRHLATHRDVGITLTVPSYGSDMDDLFGPAQLAQHVTAARTRLAQAGVPADSIAALIAPLEQLLDTPSAWQGLDGSLALFVGPGIARAYRLPVALPSQLTVGHGFRLHALVAALPTAQQFFILRVSPDDVRLLLADDSHSVELHSGVLPRGLDSSHYPTYLANVGKALGMRLGEDETRPVVLACDAADAMHLRAATSYPYVLEQVIPNDWAQGSDHQLHRAALALVSPLLTDRCEKLVQEHYDALMRGQVTSDPNTISAAAAQGTVHTLTVGPIPPSSDNTLTPVDHAIAAVARSNAKMVYVSAHTEPGSIHATVIQPL